MPEIQGRSAAGVNVTSNGHAKPTTAIASPPHAKRRTRTHTDAIGADHSQASAIPGTTNSATDIFASNPSPTQTPLQTIHRVRPSSKPRKQNQSAATQHRISA